MPNLSRFNHESNIEWSELFKKDAPFCIKTSTKFTKGVTRTEELYKEIQMSFYFKLLLLTVTGISIYSLYKIGQFLKKKGFPQTPPKPKSNKHSDLEAQSQSTGRTSPEPRQNNSPGRRAIRHGLCNIGNTCHMNSVLQSLFHLPVFANYFTERMFRSENKRRTNTLADIFYNLAIKTKCPQFPKMEQEKYLRQLKYRLGNRQQDALECLKTLLEGISKELNRVNKAPPYCSLPTQIKTTLQDLSDEWFEDVLSKENSIVTDVFYGQILNKIRCKKCQLEKLSFDAFSSLSLSFNECRQEQQYSLENMLDHFQKEENIKEKMFCKTCRSEQGQATRSLLWKLPKILVIHFKRFKSEGNRYVKIKNQVAFPTELYLSQMLESTDPSVSDCRYTLCGIINHNGSLTGGHYTANCLNQLDRKWYHFNDSYVKPARQGKKWISSEDAYILFYAKTSSLNKKN